MNHLTTIQPVSKMHSYELMHNNCYVKNGQAMYRDYTQDVTLNEYIRSVCRAYNVYTPDNDERLAWAMYDRLEYDKDDSIQYLIALLYAMMWSKADLYEHLKRYEALDPVVNEAEGDKE